MSFRTRLLVAFALLGLVPLTLFALGIRDEMTDRLTEQEDRRVAALVTLIEDDLRERNRDVEERMQALKREMQDDNRLRRAVLRSGGSAPGEDVERAGETTGDAVVDASDRAYLLDYGGEAMRMTGLTMFQIQNGAGRILSSGHFRNEYDRVEPGLPRSLAAAPAEMALVRARSPTGPFMALVRTDSFRMGDERIVLVGGLRIGPAFLERLARAHELGISLEYPGGVLTSGSGRGAPEELAPEPGDLAPESGGRTGAAEDGDREVVGEVPLAFVSDERLPEDEPGEPPAELDRRPDAPVEADVGQGEDLPRTDDAGGGEAPPVETVTAETADVEMTDADRVAVTPATARFVVTRSPAALRALRRSVDLWFLLAVALTAVAALGLASWLARRLSRPLAELAARTERLDLNRLDVDFDTDREDEVGTLSRVLGTMTERLRDSALELREAERRATVGEMARQVNHDIRNGLTPIRNVIRHLTGIAWDAPEKLSRTFLERRESLENSIGYLETLATNYARLSPEREAVRCDVNPVVRRTVRETRASGWARITTKLAEDLPEVAADPVALRRVLQNLLSNGLHSLGNGGTVSVLTRPLVDDASATPATRSGPAAPGSAGNARDVSGVELTVADTGRGIEPEDRDRIFEDFYTTREEGTGLGLSIVRRLVSDMDGTIRVESRPGLGSRFIVELPAAPGPAPGPGDVDGGGRA